MTFDLILGIVLFIAKVVCFLGFIANMRRSTKAHKAGDLPAEIRAYFLAVIFLIGLVA